MKLSKLYCNQENFKNVKFNLNGLNVIYADVRSGLKDKNNSHDLGKTKLAELIDFMLLTQVNQKKHFLFKLINENGGSIFKDYIFYLEILTNKGLYVTIKRAVATNSKISFSVASTSTDGFTPPEEFDFVDIGLDKAKNILSHYLDFNFFNNKTYDYRKALSYNLRTPPEDYSDVYQLAKFANGKHRNWKPFVFDLLGFDGDLILTKADNDEQIEEIKKFIESIKTEFGVKPEERDDLVGEMQSRQLDTEKMESEIDKFNFYEQDKDLIDKGIEEIEEKISDLNTLSYNLSYEIDKLEKSVRNNFAFDINKVSKVFQESGIYFGDQIKKDYTELVNFNNKLSVERNKLINTTLLAKNDEIEKVNSMLFDLNEEKSKLLSFIQDTDSFKKFKTYQKSLSKAESALNNIKEKISKVDLIIQKQNEIRIKEKEIEDTIVKLKQASNSTEINERYKEIRLNFRKYYKDIMNEDANLSWHINSKNNIDFPAPKVFDKITTGKTTAKDEGNTYKKLLCVAFDLAILSSYNDESYYRFVYHDDVLSQQDNGIKHRLLELVDTLNMSYDLQYILSVIKSDLPHDKFDSLEYFTDEEIVLKLHDDDSTGTLFGFEF